MITRLAACSSFASAASSSSSVAAAPEAADPAGPAGGVGAAGAEAAGAAPGFLPATEDSPSRMGMSRRFMALHMTRVSM